MALVGDALSDAQCSAKMVGICTWASVMGKDRLEGCYGGTREMVRERQTRDARTLPQSLSEHSAHCRLPALRSASLLFAQVREAPNNRNAANLEPHHT